jgi:glc operon protein GlcG
MRTKLSLTLTDATAIAAAAEEYAESQELRVSIAVVDESTYVQHVVRMDGAPYTSAEGAIEKARTAAEGGHPTTFFEEPLNAGRYSVLKMPHIYPVEGGIPVIVDGQCVGAIGVAGVLPHLDAATADAGLKALDRSDLALAPTSGA